MVLHASWQQQQRWEFICFHEVRPGGRGRQIAELCGVAVWLNALSWWSLPWVSCCRCQIPCKEGRGGISSCPHNHNITCGMPFSGCLRKLGNPTLGVESIIKVMLCSSRHNMTGSDWDLDSFVVTVLKPLAKQEALTLDKKVFFWCIEKDELLMRWFNWVFKNK